MFSSKLLLFAPFVLLAQQAAAACNADNLLNAFVKTPSAAAAFCSTYTAYASAPLPTFLATTYPASRYSSACTCIATTGSTVSSTLTTTTTSSSTISTATTSAVSPSSCLPVTITASASTVTLPASTVSVSIIVVSIVTVTATPTSSSSAAASTTSTSLTSSTSSTSAAPSCLATSVITNGGFEASSSSISPWQITGGAAGPYIETYDPHSGTYSVMAYHGAGAPAYNLVQNVTVCPDTAYTFSFWAHTDGEPYTTACQLNVCFNGVCQPATSIVASDTAWAQYSVEFAGSDAAFFPVSISTPGCGLFILYDDVAMITS